MGFAAKFDVNIEKKCSINTRIEKQKHTDQLAKMGWFSRLFMEEKEGRRVAKPRYPGAMLLQSRYSCSIWIHVQVSNPVI